MFPRLRQQLLARVDLVVELSTLGEYGVDERGGLMRLDPRAEAAPPARAPRLRDRCGDATRPQLCSVDAAVAKAPGRAVPARS